MKNVKIHYENVNLDCKLEHGPYFFMEDITKKYQSNINKVCFRVICLECGKVTNISMPKEYSMNHCVFKDGIYLNAPIDSKVKDFYDTSKRYFELLNSGNTKEECVEKINKEKKLVK